MMANMSYIRVDSCSTTPPNINSFPQETDFAFSPSRESMNPPDSDVCCSSEHRSTSGQIWCLYSADVPSGIQFGRTSTDASNGSFSFSDLTSGFVESGYRIARTVSRQARECIRDDLTMDDSDDPDEAIFCNLSRRPVRELWDTSTSSDDPISKKMKSSVDDVLDRPAKAKVIQCCPLLPKLHLGESGRAKLKSIISEVLKENPALRIHVAAVGKVKLATVPQLLQMAHICGMWNEAVIISEKSCRHR